ncbi:hypothetical protein SNEBB_005660 [Seison nebaliae]|nr:hypothetical protein SNEBB_005660 [Seison nebaliae]
MSIVERRCHEISHEEGSLYNIMTKLLPKNYNFELEKTCQRITKAVEKREGFYTFKNPLRVALQFPEGLLAYSTFIVNIIKQFTPSFVDFVIMADVTYGACCIDDFTAKELCCNFIVHYGHSCLIPIHQMKADLEVLFVFVDIEIDYKHFIDLINFNFGKKNLDESEKEVQLILCSTVQYLNSLHMAYNELRENHNWKNIKLLQSKPLSKGEVLGCTAPSLDIEDVYSCQDCNCNSSGITINKEVSKNYKIIFIGDGRFHLEAAMIANPTLEFYQYNPMNKKFTREYYDQMLMKTNRVKYINEFKDIIEKPNHIIGLIMGTLGRQGSPNVVKAIEDKLKLKKINYVKFLISEITSTKLNRFNTISAWIQVGCPRLSVDWGHFFKKPLLNPYESFVALDEAKWNNFRYPMDYYSNDSSDGYAPNFKDFRKLRERR